MKLFHFSVFINTWTHPISNNGFRHHVASYWNLCTAHSICDPGEYKNMTCYEAANKEV